MKEREGRFRGDISPSRYLKEGNTYDVSDDWFFQNKLAIRVRNRDFGELITPCNGDSGKVSRFPPQAFECFTENSLFMGAK